MHYCENRENKLMQGCAKLWAKFDSIGGIRKIKENDTILTIEVIFKILSHLYLFIYNPVLSWIPEPPGDLAVLMQP